MGNTVSTFIVVITAIPLAITSHLFIISVVALDSANGAINAMGLATIHLVVFYYLRCIFNWL